MLRLNFHTIETHNARIHVITERTSQCHVLITWSIGLCVCVIWYAWRVTFWLHVFVIHFLTRHTYMPNVIWRFGEIIYHVYVDRSMWLDSVTWSILTFRFAICATFSTIYFWSLEGVIYGAWRVTITPPTQYMSSSTKKIYKKSIMKKFEVDVLILKSNYPHRKKNTKK